MSVASASLIVALALTAAAGAAWLIVWTRSEGEQIARVHVAALAHWALAALALHLVALLLSGTAGFGAYVLTLVLACVAVVLRDAPQPRAAAEPLAPAAAAHETEPTVPRRTLWAEPERPEEATATHGLWGR